MERTNRAVTSRKNRTNARNARGMYVDGNAVRRLQEVPARPYQAPGVQTARRVRENMLERLAPTETAQSGSTEKQRKSKEHGTRFCGVPCSGKCCRTFCCVNYLQLKSELTGKIKTVASLETELSQIKEDNNAYESQVTSDVDLNTIKKLAIGRLGMNYPKDDQKKTYTMPSNSYVRQYQEVPESKR